MKDYLDLDSPLAHYKLAFPNDKDSETTVMKLLLNTANQITGKMHIDLENIEQDGLSKLELDIHTIIKIESFLEPELA